MTGVQLPLAVQNGQLYLKGSTGDEVKMIDLDPTLAAASDERIPTQKAMTIYHSSNPVVPLGSDRIEYDAVGHQLIFYTNNVMRMTIKSADAFDRFVEIDEGLRVGGSVLVDDEIEAISMLLGTVGAEAQLTIATDGVDDVLRINAPLLLEHPSPRVTMISDTNNYSVGVEGSALVIKDTINTYLELDGTTSATVTAPLVVTSNQPTTSLTTGALTVTGGIGCLSDIRGSRLYADNGTTARGINVDASGNLGFVTPVWRGIPCFAALRIGGTTSAIYNRIGTTIMYGWGFGNSTNYINGSCMIPADVAQTTLIVPRIHWVQDGTGVANVRWEVDLVTNNIGSPGNILAPVNSVAITSTLGISYANTLSQMTPLPAATYGIGATLLWRVGRIGGDPTDTFSGNVWIIGMYFAYQAGRISGVVI